MDACPTWVVAALLWLMSRNRGFRELLATGASECRALIDSMIPAALAARGPVAVSEIEAMRPA